MSIHRFVYQIYIYIYLKYRHTISIFLAVTVRIMASEVMLTGFTSQNSFIYAAQRFLIL